MMVAIRNCRVDEDTLLANIVVVDEGVRSVSIVVAILLVHSSQTVDYGFDSSALLSIALSKSALAFILQAFSVLASSSPFD